MPFYSSLKVVFSGRITPTRFFLMSYDFVVNLVDVDTGEVLFKTKRMPFTIGCHDKSIFNKYIDCFMRGVSANRPLSLSITFYRPLVIQQEIF